MMMPYKKPGAEGAEGGTYGTIADVIGGVVTGSNVCSCAGGGGGGGDDGGGGLIMRPLHETLQRSNFESNGRSMAVHVAC